jgi:hypothetical protein
MVFGEIQKYKIIGLETLFTDLLPEDRYRLFGNDFAQEVMKGVYPAKYPETGLATEHFLP